MQISSLKLLQFQPYPISDAAMSYTPQSGLLCTDIQYTDMHALEIDTERFPVR